MSLSRKYRNPYRIDTRALNTLNAAYEVADTLRCLLVEAESRETDARSVVRLVQGLKEPCTALHNSDAYTVLSCEGVQYKVWFSTHLEATSAAPATLEQAHTLCLMIDALRAVSLAASADGVTLYRERAMRNLRELLNGRGYVALNVAPKWTTWRLYVQIARVESEGGG